jgi:hypothetical protein
MRIVGDKSDVNTQLLLTHRIDMWKWHNLSLLRGGISLCGGFGNVIPWIQNGNGDIDFRNHDSSANSDREVRFS